MSELFIFTLLASIVAVYGILPEHRQFRVGYSLADKLPILILAFLAIVILLGYSANILLQPTDISSVGTITIHHLSIKITSTLVDFVQLGSTLFIMGVFLSVFALPSVRIRNEEYLLSTLRELYNREDYATLSDLVMENYIPLVNHPEKPTHPNNRSLAEQLEVALSDADRKDSWWFDLIEDRFPSVSSRVRDYTERGKYWIDAFRYRLTNTSEKAHGVTDQLLSDDEFGSKHPVLNPDLGIKVIEDDDLNRFRREQIVDRYVETQLNTQNSLLYRDLKQSRGGSGPNRPKIVRENRLIYALLSDTERMKELGLWRSISEPAREIFKHQSEQDSDRYNSQNLVESINDTDALYSDPIYAAIKFIDIMVREAFFQRSTFHMHLREYHYLTKDICDNYQVNEEEDRHIRYHNDYSLFLHEMVKNMCHWLQAVQSVIDHNDIENDEFIRTDSDTNDWGSNIPHVGTICLIDCHRQILTTDSIPRSLKKRVSLKILITCIELRDSEEESIPWQYSNHLIDCIKEQAKPSRGGSDYLNQFAQLYQLGIRDEIETKAMTGGNITGDLDEILL